MGLALGHDVLISYSHRDTRTKPLVLKLAAALRDDGVEAWIDRYEPPPPEGWPKWMTKQMRDARKVICICSEPWSQDFEGNGSGRGVSWEGVLIQAELYRQQGNNEKFIALRFLPDPDKFVPDILLTTEANPLEPAILDQPDIRHRDSCWQALLLRLANKRELAPPPIGALPHSLKTAALQSSGINQTESRRALELLSKLQKDCANDPALSKAISDAKTRLNQRMWRRRGLLAIAVAAIAWPFVTPNDKLDESQRAALQEAAKLAGQLANNLGPGGNDDDIRGLLEDLEGLYRQYPTAWIPSVLRAYDSLRFERDAYNNGEKPLTGMTPKDQLAQKAMRLSRACHSALRIDH